MAEIFEKSGYEPTVKEQAILDVLLNPEHRMKSITDICKLAGCSRNVYYEAFAKPDFRVHYESKVKDLVKQVIGPVINTFVKEALRGNFQHGKVLLEMAGLYNEKASVDVALNGDLKIQDMTRTEIHERIASLLSKKNVVEVDKTNE